MTWSCDKCNMLSEISGNNTWCICMCSWSSKKNISATVALVFIPSFQRDVWSNRVDSFQMPQNAMCNHWLHFLWQRAYIILHDYEEIIRNQEKLFNFGKIFFKGRSGAYSVLQWCYVRTCIYHIHNQSLTNVTVYFQVYMQVYLYIYIHIYVQFAHYWYLLCYKLEIWYDIYADQDLSLHGRVAPGWGQGSDCITSHIEHIQNGNRIISLIPLLAQES